MIIRTISDTHGKHRELDLITCDILIHAGDISTVREPIQNAIVVRDFIEWCKNYPAKHIVCIPGNHDTSIECKYVLKEEFEQAGIILLIHESTNIEGINFFGSPYTPEFGKGWAYNRSRHKLYDIWEDIPENTDILITHTPPKGILDLTFDRNSMYQHLYVQCGCRALLKRIQKIQPKYNIFGHIHTEADCPNSGILKISNYETTFINTSVVSLQYNVVNQGHLFEYVN